MISNQYTSDSGGCKFSVEEGPGLDSDNVGDLSLSYES